MTFHHSRDCRISPLYPHCNCGAKESEENHNSLLKELEHAQKILIEVLDSLATRTNERDLLAKGLDRVISIGWWDVS